MDDLKAELLTQYPRMTEAGATRLIGHVLEAFLDRLNTEELPDKWRNTFEMRVFEAAETSGIVQFESYSENGLSVMLNRDSMLRGITPVAKVPS